MDSLIKTVKKLSDQDYEMLVSEIGPNRFSKPYLVLEKAREGSLSDAEMIKELDVNPSTYYTLKSRLNNKIATILARNVDNPISNLLVEVTRVPAHVYSTNKAISIRALKELEKQLLEYDLTNELVSVYRTLSRLHMFSDEFEQYEKLYNKYVAFSLAYYKAEGLFYEFIRHAGFYQLMPTDDGLEKLQNILRELSNITELYDSHRLFVFYNVLRIYFTCISQGHDAEALQQKEIEIDNTLQQIKAIFEKYNRDTLYTNFNFIIDFLYCRYYQLCRNNVRAMHHYTKCIERLPDIIDHHILHFHVVEFLKTRIQLYNSHQPLAEQELHEPDIAETDLDIGREELYHYTVLQYYLALKKFLKKEYSGAARIIHQLRQTTNMKTYPLADMELKLFQALNYALADELDLSEQLLNSVNRQLREREEQLENIRVFIKMLKSAFRDGQSDKSIKKTKQLYQQFRDLNNSTYSILKYVRLEDEHFKLMSQTVVSE